MGRDEDGKIVQRLGNAADIDVLLEKNELSEKKDVDAMED